MQEEFDILLKFGLSEKEVKTYLKLLELGSATSGELMKKLGYYSKTVYEILDKLIAKGLVSFVIKANRRYFEAVDPEKFLNILKEEKSKIYDKGKEIEKIIPKLQEKRKLAKEPQEANIFLGKKGMKSVFEDVLKGGEEVLIFGGGGKFKETLGPYSKLWHKLRIRKKINLKLLWNEKLRNKKEEITEYKYLEIKFLPGEFDNPAPAMIYNDKVAITVWSEQPIAILIRSKDVCSSYKNYFNLLWGIAKK